MDARVERYRRVRGAVLRVLAKEHPRPVDLKVLRVLMNELGYGLDDRECLGHIEYLAEKEFVRREEKKAGGLRIMLVSISANGLDLIDGLKEDIGIDAGDE